MDKSTQEGMQAVLSSIPSNSHFVMEGYQVIKAGPAFPKPMMAGPDALIVLYVLHAGTQDDLLCNLCWH